MIKMIKYMASVVLVFLLCELSFSIGYKWVALKTGDQIPLYSVMLKDEAKTYVARARHFDEVLPAEVRKNEPAVISSCLQSFYKDDFEILVATEQCKWEEKNPFKGLPENLVRGGTGSTGEPIYFAKLRKYGKYNITGFTFIGSFDQQGLNDVKIYLLVCETQDKWLDSSAADIPKNAVSGGKSANGYEVFVARIKNHCSVLPGQVIPEMGISKASINDEEIISEYCQVLVGEPSEYLWISTGNGTIPDYAVVGAISSTSELMYVARYNLTVRYLTFSDAFAEREYDILVRCNLC